MQDFQYAIRSLTKRPGFTVVVVLTLALGIGANTAIFSFVYGILLQPLPYKESDRLVRIQSVRGNEAGRISMLEIEDIKAQLQIFEGVAAFIPGAQYNASGGGPPEEIAATLATQNLFEVMGVPLLHGQVWPAEYDLERNYGVVISHELWKRRFGSDLNIIGQKITLDAAPFYNVYGILPPGFNFPSDALLFRSIAISSNYPNYKDRAARNAFAIARLKPGVSYEQAQAELMAFGRRLEQEYPDINRGLSFTMVTLRDFYVGDIRPYLWLLLGAVGFVLLMACANVVNLLLSRALAREKEIALRSALGAGRGRLIRQLLTESVFLSLVGGAIGLVIAYWWISALKNLARFDLPSWMQVEINTKVLVFTFLVSIFTGILAGLAPALQASRPDLNELLKEGTRGSSSSASRHRLRRLLVIAEIALALTLLVGAGLMVKSFIQLQKVDLGFNSNDLLTFRVALPWRKFSGEGGATRMAAFFRQSLERLETLPGVEAAALNSQLPLTGETENGKKTFTAEGQSVDEQQRNPYVNDLRVSPSYFHVMGIPLISGRFLNEYDVEGAPLAAVVSQRLAERIWPGQDPIGKQIKTGRYDSKSPWMQIVGVAGNVKHDEVAGDAGLDLYVSYLQMPYDNIYLLLRAKADPLTLPDRATREIWAIDSDQSTFDFQIMQQRIADTIWQKRISGTLFIIFAILALSLAAVGIYGVMSYAVSQRTREIGIRMALGAKASDVLKMILADTLKLVLIGGGVGMLAAFVLTNLISSLLYGVSAIDPLTFVGVPFLLVLVALAAGLIPACRAARVNPIIALRYD